MNEEISRRLREAAEAHQPDRDRMLARVHRGMAGTTVRRRVRSWPKVALVGSVAAGVLAIAGLAVAGVIPTTPARPNGETTLVVPSPTTTSSSPASSRATVGSAAPPAFGDLVL
ncbi:hypothetical protein F0L68_02480, partial [Solihabitans fulvus]